MLRRYTFWLTAAILFQIMAAIFHFLSFVIGPVLSEAPEADARQFLNLFTAFSTCFPLLCLLGALTMGYLLMKHTEPALMKNLIGIHAAIFAICVAVMAVFALMPTIAMTALVFVNLLAAYIVCPKIEVSVDI